MSCSTISELKVLLGGYSWVNSTLFVHVLTDHDNALRKVFGVPINFGTKF